MSQGDLFTRSAPVDPQQEPVRAPHQGSSVQSRETSRQGAQTIAVDAVLIRERMMRVYEDQGAVSDDEMAMLLGVQRSTVNGRRWELTHLGHVDPTPKGTRKNARSGVSNSTWGLLDR